MVCITSSEVSSVGAGDAVCLEGLMSHRLLSLLIHRDRLTPIMTRGSYYHKKYVFPDLQFTTDGLLEKWIFVSGNDSPIRPYLPCYVNQGGRIVMYCMYYCSARHHSSYFVMHLYLFRMSWTVRQSVRLVCVCMISQRVLQ